MSGFFRKTVVFLFIAIMTFFATCAQSENQAEENLLDSFSVRHGSRNSCKIAITMDDIYEPEYAWKSVELCRQYGISMTFFPIGLVLKEEDGENWKDLINAGCEIGCHSMNHLPFYGITESNALQRLGHFQERLDEVLGFHYQVRWFRPPNGKIRKGNDDGHRSMKAIRRFGFNNILLWEVSETDAKKTIKNVRNGSILLFHARKKDYNCLVELIPQLLEAGFEPVTVSALFGFDLPETSDELYVFNINDYKNR